MRVEEAAQSALTVEHILPVPCLSECLAVRAQPIDHRARAQIGEVAAIIGAEFRQHAARAVVPIGNEAPGFQCGKHIAQQVGAFLPFEQAGEEAAGGCIGHADGPAGIQPISGLVERADKRRDRGGRVPGFGGRRCVGIMPPGQLEQIGALGLRQPQRGGEAGESIGRGADIAPLLDPRAPGDAYPCTRGQFLTP